MERRELEEIDRFLASVGQASLLTYYAIQENSTPADVEAFVKKRRGWAQGQQSNPKYKVEALFLIKQNALIRKALIEEPEAYRTHLRSSHVQRNVESLRVFIRGTISSGSFPASAEAAIRKQARELDLPEALVGQQIEEALAAAGVRRPADAEPTPAPSTIDFYDVLQVDPGCGIERLEQAYRARYRWARNLNDLALSAEMLNKLDQAWTVLRDPERRARYDARRTAWAKATQPKNSGVLGLLPGTAEQTSDTEQAEDAASQTPAYQVQPPAHRPTRTEPPPRLPQMQPRMMTDELEITNAGAPLPPLPVPPPPRLGPTLATSDAPQNVRTRGPKLVVDGPDTVVIRAKEARVRHRLLVRNQGDGKMPGRVVADHEWLEIAKAQLDPKLPTQVVEVVVHVDRMPWRSASATLTVVTDHGERKTITFQVTRSSMLPWAIAAGVVAFVGLAAVLAVGLLYGSQANDAVLNLTIDPAADHVYVNGTEVGSGGKVSHRVDSADAPVRVRIEAQGFSSHDELVQLEAGKSIERRIRLDLADAMDWTAPAGAQPVQLAELGAKIVQDNAPALARCLVSSGSVDAHFKVLVDPTGLPRRVDILAPAGVPPDATTCVKRVFRTMRFGKIQGDYGEVDTVAHLTAGS